MKSPNRNNVVKRSASLVGVLAASIAVALPVVAQMKPEAEVPAETTSSELKPSTDDISVPTSPNAQVPGTGTPDAQTPDAQTPASPEVAPEATTGETIVDVASASESFQTLVTALTEAELTEVLQGEGPFTVFAPTDEAFAALPAGSVEKLLQPENRAMLVQILQYHVVSGAYPSEDLSSGEVTTVEGQPVMVTVSEGGVKVNNANVIQPDITASNGVIHAIDQVIIPPGM